MGFTTQGTKLQQTRKGKFRSGGIFPLLILPQIHAIPKQNLHVLNVNFALDCATDFNSIKG